MRLRELEIALQSMERSTEYDVKLEQYPTPAPIVASVLYAAQMEYGDITDKVVCDLGCGNGIFAVGAALLGARRVVGIDIQTKALKVSQRNLRLLGTEDKIDLVLGDVSYLTLRGLLDTVVCNPPFGVKKRGADVIFLKKAISAAKVTYSMHLAGEKNRVFLKDKIAQLGGIVTQIETFTFPIKRIYEFHKKSKHLIEVDLYRIKMKECE